MSSLRTTTRKDGSAATMVLWRDDGRQRSRTFTDPRAATRWKRMLDQVGPEAANEYLDTAGAHTAPISVDEWCHGYVDRLTGIQEGTRRRYRSIIDRDITPTIGALPLSALTDDVVAGWVRQLPGAGKTIKNKHGFLSGAMAAAVKAGHIPSNPCEGHRLPRTQREEMCFLTPSDFALLLHYVPDYWQPLVSTLISTGMRWGEATALQVGDVDRDANTIRVRRAWKETSGQGHRLGPPKSARSNRTIGLPPETLELITPLLDRSPDEFVFTNTRGGPVRHATFLDNVWAPAVRLANGEPAQGGKRIARRRDALGYEIQPATTMLLGKRPRIHDLRHSHASWLIAAGVPLPVIQQQMGHESIVTTVQTYGHLDRTSFAAVTDAISRGITQALPTTMASLPVC